ncbi:hypothetical protein F5J12DRAFT_784824 [Pisolithus orientalis]|uniref:uncharacterized protein n=1 Tax=Pisolithus orientalis TaxID=936130 RepID=UPI002225515A|nr:uncharacterized protein F5J12DRAFT_784824 [Pisolithus orientalis]KAI5998982.1 hypothetical protein F5J12DRAFT_784824 [Pisolithus orientalis]
MSDPEPHPSAHGFYPPKAAISKGSHALVTVVTAGHSRKDDTIPVLWVMQAAQADVFDVGVPFYNPITVIKTLPLLVPLSLNATKTCRQGTCDAGASRFIAEDFLPEEASGFHRNCMEVG